MVDFIVENWGIAAGVIGFLFVLWGGSRAEVSRRNYIEEQREWGRE